jgi:predicted RNA-binding protein associated with RNAse of E/G family
VFILVGIHPPKRETFDLATRTNTDPKGVVRDVDVYTVEPWGLYLARPAPGRAQFHYLESWLLPALNLRVTVFHFNPGYERDQDFYLDVGVYTAGPHVWHSEDHYLDLVLRTGRQATVADVDELVLAVREGLLSPEDADRAIRTAVTTVEALARHGYHLDSWLNTIGITLTWRAA